MRSESGKFGRETETPHAFISSLDSKTSKVSKRMIYLKKEKEKNNHIFEDTDSIHVYLFICELLLLWLHHQNSAALVVIVVIASCAATTTWYCRPHVFALRLLLAHPCQDLTLRICHEHNILRPFQRLPRIFCCASELQMLDVFHGAQCGVSCAVQLGWERQPGAVEQLCGGGSSRKKGNHNMAARHADGGLNMR